MESHFLKMGIKSPLWLPDEIEMRHLYAILCTMFHRYGLYRVEFLFKLVRQIKAHDDSPFTNAAPYYHTAAGMSSLHYNTRLETYVTIKAEGNTYITIKLCCGQSRRYQIGTNIFHIGDCRDHRDPSKHRAFV